MWLATQETPSNVRMPRRLRKFLRGLERATAFAHLCSTKCINVTGHGMCLGHQLSRAVRHPFRSKNFDNSKDRVWILTPRFSFECEVSEEMLGIKATRHRAKGETRPETERNPRLSTSSTWGLKDTSLRPSAGQSCCSICA